MTIAAQFFFFLTVTNRRISYWNFYKWSLKKRFSDWVEFDRSLIVLYDSFFVDFSEKGN